ncbi:glycosyl hydrolase family 28 protein [Enterococcus sp.]|uniref:glycosyl hydrolase family 28 protein n=1 Tax=Enterococcus sp. TaxID=35783 RepID=UPI0025BF4A1A|nr:glycosyl hydrolase family 28 protein [Enterococcus sp.]
MTNKIPDFKLAPATLAADSLTLIWDKPANYDKVTAYHLYQEDQLIAKRPVNKTHITLTNLLPSTSYTFKLVTVDRMNVEDVSSRVNLVVRTKEQGSLIDVTKAPYFADASGLVKSTVKIQQAIFDCPEHGTILIPEGAVILTGALDLKSNVTFQVDGKLIASLDPKDYTITKEQSWFQGQVNQDGLPLSRYEGWELHCYRSLINLGYIDPSDRKKTVIENVRICGVGEICGGGNELGLAMREIYQDVEKYFEYYSDQRPGRRVRGRLICMMQAKNIHLTGVAVTNPSCWTIHMIYCDTVTTHGISIKSKGIDNGDGWDPDSSQNMLIFDTTFDTGDDCIAIKSGKNPEGNQINIPTKNVRIFDLEMVGGHGMAIGSEQSGGVDGVSLRDCRIKNTLYGLELKAHNNRGGYIKHITMQDCEIDSFKAHSVEYNADGLPADHLPVFSDIRIENTVINGPGRSIELIGFSNETSTDGQAYVQNVFVKNVTLGMLTDETKEIYLEKCQSVCFENVKIANLNQPTYILAEATVSNITMKEDE